MERKWVDAVWFLAAAILSSMWCLTAAAKIGPTIDEPVYLECGLSCWRQFSHADLIRLGTMPLPADVQTLPLYLWERANHTQIDPHADIGEALFWMRVGNLLFWWLLLWYAGKTGRLLAGPWGGRLAIALLACEPNLLAHAALATTDIAISACLLALLYHFRVGREAGWFRRLAIPAVWFGVAILAKASAIMFGPICLVVMELERLARTGALKTATPGATLRQRLAELWQQLKPSRRDLLWIGLGGLAVAVIGCGSDFRPQGSFVAWAHGLPDGAVASCMVWLSENVCIFSNAIEGIVRQIKHNMRGHGTYLLGEANPNALWYYFPVLLVIKLSLVVLVAPFLITLAGRVKALANWACLAALALVIFSLTYRVQIGIRLVMPVVAIGIVGLAAALVEAAQARQWRLARPALICAVSFGFFWTALASVLVWPHGLCYVNELWGGTDQGYQLVSDSNYDWGQGLPELLAWQKQNDADLDVWYFGRDPGNNRPPLREVPLHNMRVHGPADVLTHVERRYLAVSTTLLYGQVTNLAAHRNAAAFIRECEPTARTTTFLIYERDALVERLQRALDSTSRLSEPARRTEHQQQTGPKAK